MASSNFIPTRDADLANWSAVFSGGITADPTAVGLTAAQATTYTGLHDAFIAAFDIANANATRSPANIVTKDLKRKDLVENARLLAGIVQKFPGTTDTMRSELGLTIKSTPSPIPAPSEKPSIDVISVSGTTVRIRMHDPVNTTRRGKPLGVAGLTVFSYVGASAPVELSGWAFQGNTTKTVIELSFPTAAPGAKVWFTAFYRNERDESGPAADPVSTNIAGGGAMAA